MKKINGKKKFVSRKIFGSFMVCFFMASLLSAEVKLMDRYIESITSARKAERNKDYAGALEHYENLMRILSQKPDLYYHAARMNALLNEQQKAVIHLEKALKLGFDFGDELDPVFEGLRKSPGFARVVKWIEKMKQPVGSSQKAFVLPEKDLIPEGITYDPVEDCFYVGSIWKCKIIKIDRQGRISDFTREKQDGLREVLGMEVDPGRRMLWAVSVVYGKRPDIPEEELGWCALFKYDLRTGRLIKKYVLHEPGVSHLLNDVALSRNGDVYVTDTQYGAVYAVKRDTDRLELWLEADEFLYPNGISFGADDQTLYVAALHGVYKINIPDKTYGMLSHSPDITLYGIDGMYFHNNSLVCVQNGLNRISRFHLNKNRNVVERLEILEKRNPLFLWPTTGALVGEKFYYFANAQIRSFNPDGSVFPLEKLQEVVILKTGIGNDLSYLGMKPPGLKPEVFAPGIADGSRGYPSFSADGRTFCFRSGTLGGWVIAEEKNGEWSRPQILPYSQEYGFGEMTISPDGQTIVFCSRKKIKGIKESNDLDLWRMKRMDKKWKKPEHLGYVVNSKGHEAFPSLADSGNLYFFSDIDPEKGDDLFVSRWVDGVYTRPENLGSAVNSDKHDCDPFVAPDESFIVFCVRDRPEGLGKNDLFITFRKHDGSWSDAVHLGEKINSTSEEITPYITPDRKYLFFTSNRSGSFDIYWVDADFIQELNPMNQSAAHKGLYFGQKNPGDVPQVFNNRFFSDIGIYPVPLFSRDGRHVIFKGAGPSEDAVFESKMVGGQWQDPRMLFLLSPHVDRHFVLSPDEKMLFFTTRRPLSSSAEEEDNPNIWVIGRSSSGWSRARPLGKAINTDKAEYYSTIAMDGTLYFTRSLKEGNSDIFFSRPENGSYLKSHNCGPAVNSSFVDADPCIAPDESYMIFLSDRPGGLGQHDFYLTFKKEDGSWTDPVSLGDTINSPGNDVCPLVSADGQYFFFSSNRSGKWRLYWVSTEFINRLRKNE
jgi:Tol biopolymer transport system component/sugar lactone lactonase YvrE